MHIRNNIPASEFWINLVGFMENIWDSIPSSKDKILFCGIYYSPNNLSNNNEALLQLLNEATSSNHTQVILVGDFSTPGINWTHETGEGNSHQFSPT